MKIKGFKAFVCLCLSSLLFIGCSEFLSNSSSSETVSKSATASSRTEELAEYAVTGNYTATTDDIKSSLLLLLEKDSNARSIASNNYTITEDKSMTYTVSSDETSESTARSARVASYDSINFYIFDITNSQNNTEGYALTCDDRRIGEVLALVENEPFKEDISDDPFLQMIYDNIELYVTNTVVTWNSLTDEDLQTAQENMTSESTDRSTYTSVVTSGDYTYSDWVVNSGNFNNIISTNWNQSGVYNDGIEAVYGENYYTGCATTAIAQILAYNEHPETCSSTIYKTLIKKWTSAADWDGTYDWSVMKASSAAASLSSTGKMEVGALMYEIAEGLNATYGTDETSVSNSALNSYLTESGYETDGLSSYSLSSIQDSIDNDRPVLTRGSSHKKTTKHKFLWYSYTTTSYSGGHVWVIDAYCNLSCTATDGDSTVAITANFVHCNPGWGGSCNGYYLSGIFDMRRNPPASDSTIDRSTSGSAYYYQYNIQNITNIHYTGVVNTEEE
jgi:hypothetical protein